MPGERRNLRSFRTRQEILNVNPNPLRRIALIMPKDTADVREYFRQYFTSGQDYRWGESEFVVNPGSGSFDAVVAVQNILPFSREFRITCPPTRTLLAILEPPDLCFMPDGFTRQFHGVACQDSRVQCRRRFLGYAGHQWFVEIPIAEAVARPITTKPKLLSAVVSAKKDTVGHRQRFRCMEVLKAHFGDRLDWFGRGVREIGARKLDGLADYRYHLVFENGTWPHYWTEKLADAFMANCLPIYSGAPNRAEYFAPGSFVPIAVTDPMTAIERIEEAIRADRWTSAQPLLATARTRLTTEYHQLATWLRLLGQLPVGRPREIVLRPHTAFQFTLGGRLRNRLWRFRHRRALA